MKKESKKIIWLFFRYLLLIVLAFQNLFLFYLVFSPLTVYPSALILGLFYPVSLHGNTILVNSVPIELINACIAGSAFYLLLLLNLALPMKISKRLASIAFSFLIFLVINIVRISVFSVLYINRFKYFNFTHLLFWYVLSGILVFLVWFLTIKVFSVKDVPFYNDIKFLYSQTKSKKRRR